MKQIIKNPDGTIDFSACTIIKNDEPTDLREKLSTAAYEDENHLSFVPPPKISLDIFVSEFLPGLVAQDTAVKNRWIDLINNGYGRVDLVDRKGDVVTWVPPMHYGLVSKDQGELNNAADAHRNFKEIHKSSADARFLRAIQANVQTQRPPRSHIDQWKHLVLTYHEKLINKNDANQAGLVESNIDDENYEEW